MIRNFDDLLAAVSNMPKKRIVIASPEGGEVIKLVRAALEQKVADFVLVGDRERIASMAHFEGFDCKDVEIIHRTVHKDAAEEAVGLVVAGKANAIMKGNLPTSTFLKAILDKQKGLNNNTIISEVTLHEKIEGEGLQLITDCAINISPTLDEKVQIVNNAVQMAHRLGYQRPRVAVLSAVEVVNPAIPDTLDAAVLSKMSERGQIKGCIIDGPFALDNAVSLEAARYKNLDGEVAGRADIILAPNLQVGNPLHKALVFFARRKIASAVLGARAPIVMTSRSDSMETMLLTIALAAYISPAPE
ncbi:bifunctional enoyl-CoA hydratase/phosphate acetyltransferase [Geobacter sp. AOG1]|uniref:bifunctional enoyl-CoA hydratase/phosphate acetyltransferase n=1 Tax=Geobacter sp. AOG1 TaxID=1566346 RepID=UPI001CC61408|nr:bifunctional enoyl-CoA hydratase/phosphate acetyltransferase [Geobacter sp. AOG1]GFE56313.1 phosphate butyryltransferase [Geobacter sp. AOG1]